VLELKCSLSNAYTLSDQRHDNPSAMARVNKGSHSFTCHSHVYPRMEWAILHAFHKHSADGIARARQRTSASASSIDLERMKRWVGPVGWPYSGWFTHMSDCPSATGPAWDRESSPVKDQSSATAQCSQLGEQGRFPTLQLSVPILYNWTALRRRGVIPHFFFLIRSLPPVTGGFCSISFTVCLPLLMVTSASGLGRVLLNGATNTIPVSSTMKLSTDIDIS